jgi:hypothetical protein
MRFYALTSLRIGKCWFFWWGACPLAASLLSCTALAEPVEGARTCTVLYDLDATFQITDTPFGAADETYAKLDGMLVLRFTADQQGVITDGPVEILHFWMYQDFQITGLVTLTTNVHAFSPSCNGEREPSWRVATDPRFPSVCRYTGNTRAVARGSLDLSKRQIEWASCDAADTYWSEERHGQGSYQQSDVSSGEGCLSKLRWVGNIHCRGLCGLGSPDRGDNPVFDVWTQPLITGPKSKGINAVTVSGDGRVSGITTPAWATGGYQSYNVPNDDRSRTWMGWVGARRDSSRFTTCR